MPALFRLGHSRPTSAIFQKYSRPFARICGGPPALNVGEGSEADALECSSSRAPKQSEALAFSPYASSSNGTFTTRYSFPRRRACARGLGHRSDLLHQINSLSAAEKAELLEVWQSLEADAVALTGAQHAELDHGLARPEQNPSDVVPWEQVQARLFQKP